MFDKEMKMVEKIVPSDTEILTKTGLYICPTDFLCGVAASVSNPTTKEMQTVRDLMLAGF